jgi:hypothetical protein
MNMDPMDFMRMMANSAYSPKEICSLLADSGGMEELRDLIRRGSSIDAYMQRRHFQPAAEPGRRQSVTFDLAGLQKPGANKTTADILEQFRRFKSSSSTHAPGTASGASRGTEGAESAASERRASLLSWMESKFQEEEEGDGMASPSTTTHRGRSIQSLREDPRHRAEHALQEEDEGDDEEELDYRGFATSRVTQARPLRFPKGNVLHFIPTKQIKLLRGRYPRSPRRHPLPHAHAPSPLPRTKTRTPTRRRASAPGHQPHLLP